MPHQRGWNEGGVKTREWIADAFARPRQTSNIGIRCVPELLILDCDVHAEGAAGHVELYELYADNGLDAPDPTLLTGGGGVHVWLRVPDDAPPLFCNRKLLPNVDTRTGGLDRTGRMAKVGQVVVPPSLHTSGDEYRWRRDQLPPALADLPEAPGFILEALEWEPSGRTAGRPPRDDAQWEAAPTSDGFDHATGGYWRKAVDALAAMEPGGEGRRGRNTTLFALGATARRLANAEPQRRVPGKAAMMADALAAARAAGLPDDDLARQFENGWRDVGSADVNWPPITERRNVAAAHRRAATQ